MDSLLGKQLDEYRLEALLGQGGMARVYRGVDTALKRYVAIKVIDAQFRDDSEYARRFELEAQSLGQLNHPNVVQLYRYGRVGDVLYMAMSYIEGSDVKAALDDYHAMGEFMALDEALRILRESAQALDYVHSKNIIHRDIKPSNIMLAKDGTAVLTDFGLALMTQVGTMGEIFGTPQYLSPEQAISSAAVVPQSDLYSLGIIAYEMFTGQIPFDGDEPMTVAVMHMNDSPPAPRSFRPELTESVEAVLLKAIEKEPADRYQTGAEFVQALTAAVKGDSELKRRTSMPRLSIPQLVALEIEKNPLPPIPAAVTPVQKKSVEMPSITERAASTQAASSTTKPHIAAPTQPSTNPPGKPRTAAPPKMTTETKKAKPKSLMSYAPYALVGTIIALVLIIAALLLSGGNRPNLDATASAEAFILATSTEINIEASASAIAYATGLAQSQSSVPITVTPVSISTQNQSSDNSILQTAQAEAAQNLTQNAIANLPASTALPQSRTIELEFRWEKDDWLTIENLGSSPLNLALLSITSEESESHLLSGESFGDSFLLQAGQCVAFAKPNQVDRFEPDCVLADIIAIDNGPDRVWKESFNIYYLNRLNEQPIRTCDGRDANRCTVSIIVE
jgi:serine/threonine protein kinase